VHSHTYLSPAIPLGGTEEGDIRSFRDEHLSMGQGNELFAVFRIEDDSPVGGGPEQERPESITSRFDIGRSMFHLKQRAARSCATQKAPYGARPCTAMHHHRIRRLAHRGDQTNGRGEIRAASLPNDGELYVALADKLLILRIEFLDSVEHRMMRETIVPIAIDELEKVCPEATFSGVQQVQQT